MRNLWLVARREFVGRGRSSGYLITTVLMTLVLLGSSIAPTFFQSRSKSEPLNVLLLDRSGAVAQPLTAAVQAMAAQPGARQVNIEVVTGDEAQLTDRAKKENKALLIVDGTFPVGLKARFLSTSPTILSGASAVTMPLESVVRAARLQAQGINPAVAQEVMNPLPIETSQITEKGGQRDQHALEGSMMAALGIIMVMYMVVMINGQFVFVGVLEEKVSRVMEVMAAAVGPGEMLAGKLMGLGGLGLIQFAAMMAASYGGTLVNQRLSDTPSAGISAGQGLTILVFLILGYVFSAALNAAGAATISRMEDQTAVSTPLSMIQVVPFLMFISVMTNPNSTLSVVLSFVPVFSQTVMVARVLMTDVPIWQIVTSMVIMAASTGVMVWAGGRIYRAAMLMYGARPSLKQVFSYLRA